jgi:diacylglycerol kinase family enzyme
MEPKPIMTIGPVMVAWLPLGTFDVFARFFMIYAGPPIPFIDSSSD